MAPRFYSLQALLLAPAYGSGFIAGPSLVLVELAEQIADENNA